MHRSVRMDILPTFLPVTCFWAGAWLASRHGPPSIIYLNDFYVFIGPMLCGKVMTSRSVQISTFWEWWGLCTVLTLNIDMQSTYPICHSEFSYSEGGSFVLPFSLDVRKFNEVTPFFDMKTPFSSHARGIKTLLRELHERDTDDVTWVSVNYLLMRLYWITFFLQLLWIVMNESELKLGQKIFFAV